MNIKQPEKVQRLISRADKQPALLFFAVAFVIGLGALAVATTQLLKVLSYSYIVLNILIILVLGKEE